MFIYHIKINRETDLNTVLSLFKDKLYAAKVKNKEQVYSQVIDIINIFQKQMHSNYNFSIKQCIAGEDYEVILGIKSENTNGIISKILKILSGKK